jgi:Tol biopolymer transport system component
MGVPQEPDGAEAPAAVRASRGGSSRLFAFLEELRRRRVIRALVVYGAIAFAVLQVVEPIMHGLHLPESVLSVVVLLLGLGFPLAAGLSWVYDLTATGLSRTAPATGLGGTPPPRGARLALLLLAVGGLMAAPGIAYHFLWGPGSPAGREAALAAENPLAGARFQRLTDFDGVKQSAAISRDGRFVAFQSDRAGRMDVWVTQVGTGQFTNLTRGSAPELVNPSIRALGFSPDGALVTFWARGLDGPGGPDIGIWAVPLLGGVARPYLEGVAEYDWTADGAQLAFHTPGPGDPLEVSATGRRGDARTIYSAPAGLHGHFPVWSPDRSFIYFVQGGLPDRLDLWRIRPGGGSPERISRHNGQVSHPVFLDARTLLYLATDADGFGPWIHALDLERRQPRRVGPGVDAYTSLSASADGRWLVTTVANRKVTLWRVPLADGRAHLAAAQRIPLDTGAGTSPRLGPSFLVYVSSKGTGDGLWKLQAGAATELWSAADARIIGPPALSRDGRRVAFASRQGDLTSLHVVNVDGTGARVLTTALQLRGAPAWAPDGGHITAAGVVDGVPRLFAIPVDGGPPTPWLAEQAVDPVWSPDGDVVVYSGADVGTTFPVKAARADGQAAHFPTLVLTRGARHISFMPGRRALLVLKGEIRHKDLWLVDLDDGTEKQVTDVGPDFDLRDFDASPDGRELVLEQVQEPSDVVLIERSPR